MILLPSVSGPWYCCKIASSATDTRRYRTRPDISRAGAGSRKDLLGKV